MPENKKKDAEEGDLRQQLAEMKALKEEITQERKALEAAKAKPRPQSTDNGLPKREPHRDPKRRPGASNNMMRIMANVCRPEDAEVVERTRTVRNSLGQQREIKLKVHRYGDKG